MPDALLASMYNSSQHHESASFVPESTYIQYILRIEIQPFSGRSAMHVLVAVFCVAYSVLLSLLPTFAGLITSPSQLPTTTFDYIIVGGTSLNSVNKYTPTYRN